MHTFPRLRISVSGSLPKVRVSLAHPSVGEEVEWMSLTMLRWRFCGSINQPAVWLWLGDVCCTRVKVLLKWSWEKTINLMMNSVYFCRYLTIKQRVKQMFTAFWQGASFFRLFSILRYNIPLKSHDLWHVQFALQIVQIKYRPYLIQPSGKPRAVTIRASSVCKVYSVIQGQRHQCRDNCTLEGK